MKQKNICQKILGFFSMLENYYGKNQKITWLQRVICKNFAIWIGSAQLNRISKISIVTNVWRLMFWRHLSFWNNRGFYICGCNRCIFPVSFICWYESCAIQEDDIKATWQLTSRDARQNAVKVSWFQQQDQSNFKSAIEKVIGPSQV